MKTSNKVEYSCKMFSGVLNSWHMTDCLVSGDSYLSKSAKPNAKQKKNQQLNKPIGQKLPSVPLVEKQQVSSVALAALNR